MLLFRLLKLQVFYCLIGILFNVVSWIMIQTGHQALTPTVPLEGFIAMSVYGLFLLTGYFRKIGWYRLLMFISILTLGHAGVLKNILTLNQHPELYTSIFIGIIGIAINIFGLVLNCIAVFGLFNSKSQRS